MRQPLRYTNLDPRSGLSSPPVPLPSPAFRPRPLSGTHYCLSAWIPRPPNVPYSISQRNESITSSVTLQSQSGTSADATAETEDSSEGTAPGLRGLCWDAGNSGTVEALSLLVTNCPPTFQRNAQPHHYWTTCPGCKLCCHDAGHPSRVT